MQAVCWDARVHVPTMVLVCMLDASPYAGPNRPCSVAAVTSATELAVVRQEEPYGEIYITPGRFM
jgi:hypothetical protein